jgi:uncharacterized membrane protein YvbJ
MDFESFIHRRESAPCPSCDKHILQDEMICCHCGYEFTAKDRRLHNLYIDHHRRKGKVLATKIFPILIVVLAILFFLWER